MRYTFSQKWTLTIKVNRNNLEERTLDMIYRYIISHYKRNLKLKITNIVYELDSQGKLHLHGMVEAPPHIRFNHLNILGCEVWKEKMTDFAGWMRYCHKNVYQLWTSRHFNVRSRDEMNSLLAIQDYISSAPPANVVRSEAEHEE